MSPAGRQSCAGPRLQLSLDTSGARPGNPDGANAEREYRHYESNSDVGRLKIENELDSTVSS